MTQRDRSPHLLDDPVGASLRGHHAGLAEHRGRALRYDPAVASFVALPLAPEPADWADLARLLGPGGLADLFSSPAEPPGWEPVFALPGVQMVAPQTAFDPDPPEVVELGSADVPDMLDLAAATRPGPFRARTHEMGTYLGVRRGGRLVAMAGERLHPPGRTEISAVCTSPEARGGGLAGRLVGALTARVTARGERAFLHVAAANTGAIRVYERLGFEVRRDVVFRGFRVPPP